MVVTKSPPIMSSDKTEAFQTLESVRVQIDEYQTRMAEMVEDEIISLKSYFDLHQASCFISGDIHDLVKKMKEDPTFDGELETRRIVNQWADLLGELDGLYQGRRKRAKASSAEESTPSGGVVKVPSKDHRATKASLEDDLEVLANADDIDKFLKILDSLSEELIEKRKFFAKSEKNTKPEVISDANRLMTTIRLRIERLEHEVKLETKGWIQNQLRILREEMDLCVQLKDLSGESRAERPSSRCRIF